MKKPTPNVAFRRACAWLAALTCLLPGAGAYQFSSGEWSGSFDTTLSFGGLYRLSSPDAAYYGRANGGLQNSVNADDGNLNYDKGWVSALAKVSHDFQLSYRDYGMFLRGYYFTDLKSDETKRTPLSKQAEDRVKRGAELLDMYVYGQFDLDGIPVDLRFGRQVLSLGESTFIPNGNNVVNPVDLSKLRNPGAELKEAFLPVNMIKASIGLTPNITIEPFWLLEFRRNELEPAGTYFSTNDFASRGGDTVWLGFGGIADIGGVNNTGLGGILRDKDHERSNFNQYGIASHIYTKSGLDIGLYYARYHSRSPVISARTPTGPVSSALVVATASNLATAQLAPAMVGAGYPAAGVPSALSTLIGAALTNVPAAALPASLQPFYPAARTIAAGAQQIGLLTAAKTGRYIVEYPDGIDMFGASVNADLGSTGISWQADVSFKKDVPLQIDDVELLFAALSSLTPIYGASNQVGSYLGQYSTYVPGYRRHDVWTAQSTMTKVFGPTLGASQLVVVGEAGGLWANLPAQSTLRYDGPGSFTSGSVANMATSGNPTLPATSERAFADDFSWGYQMLARLDYNNAFAGLNVSPSIAFSHDVSGTTPLPLGNFIHGRKSVTIGAEFVYQNSWAFELRYVNYFGAKDYNLLNDRDYVAATIKYSF
ncbi:MAG: DUF1302 domain-containing protein [Opitutaceae bacterium]|nr:DUF1302 domain-containing protein [Opitutaceae bacterium]